jgi:hypothetical protein
MYPFRVKCVVGIFVILWSISSSAQTGSTSNPTNGHENNPYSRYGIGELLNGNSTVLKGMGGTTSAFAQPLELNTDNPASYSYLTRTTFEFGAMAETRNVAGSGLSYRTGTASISYLSLGIPVSKHTGFCLGFKPVSRSYYNLADTVVTPSIGKVVNSYNGEGAMNYVFIGGATKFGGFSVGVNAGYVFGNLRNSTAAVPIDTTPIYRAYTSEYSNYTQVGGLYWKAGLMYETRLDSDFTLRIGGTLSMKENLVERLNAYQISSFNFGDTLVNDTISQSGEQHGKLVMPMTYSIGVSLARNNKWNIGLDYTATKWSDFSSTPDAELNTGVGSGSYKIALGGEYTPDVNNIRTYISRVTYRAGLYYGTDYLKLSNTSLPFFGVNVGGSLPFRRYRSPSDDQGVLHLAFDIGRMGTQTNNLIQQTYVRFSLGISFNSKWFIPRKYD